MAQIKHVIFAIDLNKTYENLFMFIHHLLERTEFELGFRIKHQYINVSTFDLSMSLVVFIASQIVTVSK